MYDICAYYICNELLQKYKGKAFLNFWIDYFWEYFIIWDNVCRIKKKNLENLYAGKKTKSIWKNQKIW